VRPLPRSTAGWEKEILIAFADAAGNPFVDPTRPPEGAEVLFHLGPHVAIKYRGAPEKSRKRVVKAALASFVASQDTAANALRVPIVAFAFTYMAAHFALELVSDRLVNRVMDTIVETYG
jgi:hypothetical protein